MALKVRIYDHDEAFRLLGRAVEEASRVISGLSVLKNKRVNHLLGAIVERLGKAMCDGPPIGHEGIVALGVSLDAAHQLSDLITMSGDEELSLVWLDTVFTLDRRIRDVVSIVCPSEESAAESAN